MAAKLALDQLDSLDDDAKAALEGVMDDLEEVCIVPPLTAHATR